MSSLTTSEKGWHKSSRELPLRNQIFKRGSTFVAGTSSSGAGVGYFRDGSGRVKAFTTSANALDSPATTSSTTYTMKYDGYTNNSGGEFTNEGTTMTLMEIAQ